MPTLADLLLDGYPQTRKGPSSNGATYKYRGDYATITAALPATGDIWVDSRPVTGVEHYQLGRSDWGELIVETEVQTGITTAVSTTLVETRYEIEWEPNDIPLEQHSQFGPGGGSDLFAPASGSPARIHMADVIGWENEQDPHLKANYQYRPLRSDGSIGPAITLGGGAYVYANLRLLGFPTAPAFLPIWTKTGTYNGTSAPGVGAIGQYVTAPDGPGFPKRPNGDDFEWVKIEDRASRVGRKTRWERSESWKGYIRVYLDIDAIDPVGHL